MVPHVKDNNIIKDNICKLVDIKDEELKEKEVMKINIQWEYIEDLNRKKLWK